jgi:hypothetical protein
MEARGRIVNQYGATIHTANINHQDVYKNKDYNFTDSDITSYHDYGVLWDESGFKFYIDGEMFFEVKSSTYQNNNPFYTDTSSNAPFDQPFHILLNLAVGGNYDNGRTVDSSFEEAEIGVMNPKATRKLSIILKKYFFFIIISHFLSKHNCKVNINLFTIQFKNVY